MRKWLLRVGYALAAIVWLLVMTLPVLAVVLSMQREIAIGDASRRQLRIFLIQERESEGISVQWTRAVSAGEHCTQSNVYYLMWKGAGDNATFCQCYDATGAVTSSMQQACPPP
ncbi:MAG TPA: hypothetical protein VK879_04450 [Candidatus Sulfomarinibacteraceae bacterium]|nr:hypothetical protein [Candidatus Sulfomarinibacteraceae bacterium]